VLRQVKLMPAFAAVFPVASGVALDALAAAPLAGEDETEKPLLYSSFWLFKHGLIASVAYRNKLNSFLFHKRFSFP
jgi:hypothetical protein